MNLHVFGMQIFRQSPSSASYSCTCSMPHVCKAKVFDISHHLASIGRNKSHTQSSWLSGPMFVADLLKENHNEDASRISWFSYNRSLLGCYFVPRIMADASSVSNQFIARMIRYWTSGAQQSPAICVEAKLYIRFTGDPLVCDLTFTKMLSVII